MTAPTAPLLPRIADVRTGALDSLLFTRMRWRALRGPRQRALVWAGFGAVAVAMLMAINIGTAIYHLAQSSSDTAAQTYALIVMSQLQGGHLTGLTAGAFATAVGAAFISPFTGTANAPLYPDGDVASLRPNRMHRFTDSIITHVVSAVGFLSLFALTALASVLTATSGRWVGLVATWSIWPVLISLGTAEAWALELVRRRFGQPAARAVLVIAVVGIGLLAVNDRAQVESMFGLGNFYAAAITVGVHDGFGAVVPLIAVCLGMTAGLLAIGCVCCHHALRYPDATGTERATLMSRLRVDFTGGPLATAAQLVLSQVLRHPQVMRPILAVGAIAVPAAWLTAGHGIAVSTVMLGIPIAVTVSWAVNIFGIIGPGMTWLASTPMQRRTLLAGAIAVHAGLIAVLFTLCWLPAWIAGRIGPGLMLSVLAGTVTATLMVGRSAFSKAVNRPVRAVLRSSTDTVVPPIRAIGYALRMTAWGGQIAVGVLSISDHRLQWLAVLGVAAWVSGRYWLLLRKVERRDVMSRIVATVAD